MTRLTLRRFLMLLLCIVGATALAFAQTPKITSITKILAQQQYQTITIKGSGFGTMAPYSGDSDYIAYGDFTTGFQCGYAPDGNVCGLIVNSWADSEVVLGGFSLSNPEWLPYVGNDVQFVVWNAQTGDGPSKSKKVAVIADKTTTTLTSSPNPSTDGQSVTFTADVAAAVGAPPDGETVSFLHGKTVLGTGSLSGGTATFVTSTLPVGTTPVTAEYSGDSAFKGSKSTAVEQVVQ